MESDMLHGYVSHLYEWKQQIWYIIIKLAWILVAIFGIFFIYISVQRKNFMFQMLPSSAYYELFPGCIWLLEPVLRRLNSGGPRSFLTSAQGWFKPLFLKWMIERQSGVQLMGVKGLFVAQQILQNWVCVHKGKSFTALPLRIQTGPKYLGSRSVRIS